jgi:putative nucleotidyltransferase with HDIG domain
MATPEQSKAIEEVSAQRVRKLQGHYEIPTALFVDKIDLNMPTLPPVKLYVRENNEFRLIKPKEQPYSMLALSLHPTVWVDEEEFPEVKAYADGFLLKPSQDHPPEKRMDSLRKSAMLVVEDLFERPSPENIQKSVKVVGSFVYVLMKEPKSYMLLANLSSHDPYTLQHSVGTAVNSIILAKKVGVSDEKDLLDVGIAGLLHDIGKVKVRKEVINKEGPLDELEWQEMEQHSQAGYDIVVNNPGIDSRAKRAILEHHEDKNRGGYPQKIPYDEVHLFSKIVCISDVFNALTTNRSYSKARSPFEAFQLMKEKLAHKLDDEMYKNLVLIYGGKID